MKALWIASLSIALTVSCQAEQTLAKYDWRNLSAAGQLTAGTAEQKDGRSVLKLVNTNDAPMTGQLLKILKPPVTKRIYALVGEIKYDNVQGDGYLELWNYFPFIKPGLPEGQYFSRTLGESGEMRKLTGSSDWRRFLLPFNWSGASNPPTRLELNLYLPGRGTVWLGPMRLVEYSGNGFNGTAAVEGAWWSERMAGVIGGLGGAVLGCMGTLLAWLASRGKCRGFVMGLSFALILLGVAAAVIGLVALGLKQPYAVWFPLLLVGSILLLTLPSRLKHYQKHYAELELRRMASMDVAGR